MARLVAVIVAGWMPVMTGTTQTLAFRIRAVAGPDGWAATYSLVSSAGWLVSIFALVAAGVLHDRGVRRAATDDRPDPAGVRAPQPVWVRASPVLLVAAAAVVTLGRDVATVAAGWLVMQVPAAALVTVAGARLADVTPPGRRWATAALTGSGPGLGLAVGSALVAAAGAATVPSVLAPALLSAALVFPALRRGELAPRPDTDPAPPTTGRTALRSLVVLLVAVALVDTGLSTGLIYAVPAVDRALDIPFADVSVLTSRLVLLATLLTLLGNVLGGALARLRGGATAGFALSAAALGAALVLLGTTTTTTGLGVAFGIAGLAAGVSNGTTFAIYLETSVDRATHGSGLGWLNAVPTVPFVLVPAAAAPVLRDDVAAGVGRVLTGGAAASAAAMLLAVTVGVRWWARAATAASRSAPGPRS